MVYSGLTNNGKYLNLYIYVVHLDNIINCGSFQPDRFIYRGAMAMSIRIIFATSTLIPPRRLYTRTSAYKPFQTSELSKHG